MELARLTLTRERAGEVRRGVRLEWLTVVYNSLEGIVALVAGAMAGSVALVGFGFDSAIEVASGSRFCGVFTWTGVKRRASTPRGALCGLSASASCCSARM
jgi:hypothetical protein